MAFERSKFGDGSAAGAGNVITTVSNHFGRRTELDEESMGIINTEGVLNQLVVDFDSATLVAQDFPLQAFALPARSKVTKVLVDVREAFVLGGTTPAAEIGTSGSAATNGFAITEAQLEALGVYDVTASLGGTWANMLAARTVLGIAFTGTAPTATAVGRARVIIEYAKIV